MRKALLLFFFIVAIVTLAGIRFETQLINLTKLIFTTTPSLKETNGKTNILLLGIGGGVHAGPNLTDTIIVASIDKQNNKITLISIPRDLWVTEVGDNGGKINEAYADGQMNNQQKGLQKAEAVVSKVTGLPIHYGLRIDFGGFVKVVDLIGGIDVTVADTLDDYHYPIDGQEDAICGHTQAEIQNFNATNPTEQQTWDFFSCRYMHLHVPAGMQHMNGMTALAFVRSRHGIGNEGTDFARSRRQQLVIEAIRNKIFSLGIILNPSKVMAIYAVIQNSIDTDIPESVFPSFISLAQKLKTASIHTAVIDYGDASQNRVGLLISPPISSTYYFEYVLLPRIGEGNFSEIQWYVSCEITVGNCTVPQTPIIPTISQM
ncbi:MAG TPA: LCP family protein [Patescibacteria group bacterium]